MKIILNGKDYETSAKTIAELLPELNLVPTQVAIEYNGTVLFRHEFTATKICEKDSLEIVQAVAGG